MPERFNPVDHQDRYLVTILSEQFRIALNIDLFEFVQVGKSAFAISSFITSQRWQPGLL